MVVILVVDCVVLTEIKHERREAVTGRKTRALSRQQRVSGVRLGSGAWL